MKTYILKYILIIVLFTSICIPLMSKAIGGVSSDDIQIELNPAVPVPGSNVTATLKSYATNLNRAHIEWLDNSNNILSSGTGDTTYTITSSGANSSININISITAEGESQPIFKQISIHPSNIDIIWQTTNTYTPPFYKGKALATSESTIRAVAMPGSGGVADNIDNIVYNWKLSNNNIVKSSGTGKDTFEFKNSYLRESEDIKVNASSITGSYNAENSINIPIINSKILFYLKNIDGVTDYNLALDSNSKISNDESTFVAEPYFLLVDSLSTLNYEWKINNNIIATPTNPRVLTIRPASSGGYATISLDITNISLLFQSVASTLKINL